MTRLSILAACALGACTQPPSATEFQAVSDERPGDQPVVRVALEAPPELGFRWQAELRGTVLLHLEAGLAELRGVVPHVGDRAIAVGLSDAVQTDAVDWQATVTLSGNPDAVLLGVHLCGPTDCVDHQATGTRSSAYAAIADVLESMAVQLGRDPAPGATAAWASVPSMDGYATMMEGRSAAVWYGMLPAPKVPGDRRSDPITRAVHLDPKMPLAQWVASRRALAAGDAATAKQHAVWARERGPDRVLLRANEAALLLEAGKAAEARRAWAEVQVHTSDDPRFAVLRARAALGAGKPAEATDILDTLGGRYQEEARVLAVRVAIADVVFADAANDELLARWAEASPENPEPVRRRVRLRVADRRYADALSQVAELRVRETSDEPDRLELALRVATGDLEAAIATAEGLGENVVAARIRARRDLQADPTAVPDPAGLDDPVGRAVRARALLAAKRPADALREAEAALRGDPWLPEAWRAKTGALAALGLPTATSQATLSRLAVPAAAQGSAAADAGDLAPGPERVLSARHDVQASLTKIGAIETALARLQNRWSEVVPDFPKCDTPELGSLAARLAVLGPAHRDQAQLARVRLARLRRLTASPTAAPLLGESERAALDVLAQRIERHTRVQLEASVWHRGSVAPFLFRCKPRLEASPGLEPPVPVEPGPVAMIGLGNDKVCPADVPADGSVVVIDPARACVASVCPCELSDVLPGAVMKR